MAFFGLVECRLLYRLQNGRFFPQGARGIFPRSARASHSLALVFTIAPALLFDRFDVLDLQKIRTVLQTKVGVR